MDDENTGIVRKNFRRPLRQDNSLMKVLGIIGKVLGTCFLIGITTAAMLGCIFAIYVDKYISTDINIDVNLDDFSLDQTSFIYYFDDATGQFEVLDEIYWKENRVWVGYDEIPEYVCDALVSIEDKRFYKHRGVDWKRTTGAFFNMFLGMRGTFGGSTLTQQLIKNLTDDDETIVRRKIQEIFRALEFERNYDKDQILEWYLNTAYFSRGCWGIQAAAKTYFGKDVGELTLGEAASIVGITNLPTKFDPYLNRENNKERQETILFEMWDQGYISEEEYRAAIAQKLVFKRDAAYREETDDTETVDNTVRSYFTDQVITDVVNDLVTEKGISESLARQLVYSGGYKIYATIDMDIQNLVDEVYTNPEYWPTVADADSVEESPQSAIVIMDPSNGNIVAMYGSLGKKNANLVLNRASASKRQPGSAIKPISVYATALDAGLITPYSVYTDMPVTSDAATGKTWPKNQNGTYQGQVTVMYAVQRSLNTIATRIVTDMGADRCFKFASENMGLSTLVEKEVIGEQVKTDVAVAPMSMGALTHGVTVRDMCQAYSVFPNKGIFNESRTYSRVEDSRGTVVLDNAPESRVAMKEKTAFYMNQLLQNVVNIGTGTPAKMANMPVAGKTGTTDEDFDRWFVGYTPYYSAAVWYGYDYNREVNISGNNPALTLWKAVMDKIHANLAHADFFTPTEKLISASYCVDSGDAPTEICRSDLRGSRAATGLFFEEDVPTRACSVHQWANICTESGHIATNACQSVRRAGLLLLDRRLSVSGVVLGDEQYTFPDTSGPIVGSFRVSVSPKITSPVNALCPLHPEGSTPDTGTTDTGDTSDTSDTSDTTDTSDTGEEPDVSASPEPTEPTEPTGPTEPTQSPEPSGATFE